MAKRDHQVQVTLSDDLAEAVARKVRSGAYPSADEVLRDGLRALIERDSAVERRLQDELVAGHAESPETSTRLFRPMTRSPDDGFVLRPPTASGRHHRLLRRHRERSEAIQPAGASDSAGDGIPRRIHPEPSFWISSSLALLAMTAERECH